MFFFFLLGVALVWLAQLICTAVIAAPVPLVVWLATKKKRAAKLVFALCLLLELAVIGAVAHKPFFRCPEEYRSYVSAEEEKRIVGFNRGLWSLRVPVFPVCVTVTKVDESSVYVRTKYLFFGTAEMGIGRLGSPDPTPSWWTGLRWWPERRKRVTEPPAPPSQ